ncbi:MAG TPA: hypothetical protein VD908_07860, partial [Cytophagales bacterium]|nr:hypothetical protein [Cytophagales bacterium]
IEPLENNKSKLTYLMWSEPGKFVIPQSIITPIVVNSIHATMKSMKEILKKDKYKNADMSYLK